jgi:PAS domain-containing protein
VDAAGRNVLTNAAYGRLFGETDLVALDNIGDSLPRGQTPQSRVAAGETYSAEFQVVTREGERSRFKAEGRPIGQEGGRGGVIVIHPLGED